MNAYIKRNRRPSVDLLNDPLIRKYFGDIPNCKPSEYPMAVAYRVLLAMQEPIRKGERYLYIDSLNGLIVQEKMLKGEVVGIPAFHPFYLRLPAAHQKRECV